MTIICMGVSGSGKTTVGKALAQELGWPFLDGDDFHPPENVTKMEAKIPLTDEDRWPWLKRMKERIAADSQSNISTVWAASALKASYRDIMQQGESDVRFVYLQGTKAFIWQRMQARTNHFMPPELLDSQFDTLEEPGPQEALILPISDSAEEQVARIIANWDLKSPQEQ